MQAGITSGIALAVLVPIACIVICIIQVECVSVVHCRLYCGVAEVARRGGGGGRTGAAAAGEALDTRLCCSVLQGGPGNNEYEEGYEYDKKSVQGNNYG